MKTDHANCNHSPCVHERKYALYCQDEQGQRTLLATGYYVNATAAQDLIDLHWDDRLTCASCSPVIKRAP